MVYIPGLHFVLWQGGRKQEMFRERREAEEGTTKMSGGRGN